MKFNLLTKMMLVAAVAVTPVAAIAQQYPETTLEQVREQAETDRGVAWPLIFAGALVVALAIYFIAKDGDEDMPLSP